MTFRKEYGPLMYGYTSSRMSFPVTFEESVAVNASDPDRSPFKTMLMLSVPNKYAEMSAIDV